MEPKTFTSDPQRQLMARAGFLDLLVCIQKARVPVTRREQDRMAAAWDAVRLPEDTPLRFYENNDTSPIIMPIGDAAMPTRI